MSHIRRFAPDANLLEDEKLDSKEIDILVSTEVLAEGQNLQDCNYVINYDLPWNPMRIVQRTGRVDRLTSRHDVIRTRACYPDRELDDILKLMGKLLDKIHVVDTVIGGDEEVLGEAPTPKQFNGAAHRIKVLAGGQYDGSADRVISKMEQESDVMPALSPINELGRFIKEKGIETVQDIPLGRRSGKMGDNGQKAILAYLQEGPERRVYFVQYDFETDRALIPDDDSEAIRLASCARDTPMHLPMDGTGNQESFELLLKIDPKARRAIKENNDTISSYVRDLHSKKSKQHDRNVDEVSKIMMGAILNGEIVRDEGKEVIRIAKSEYVRHWADDLNSLLLEYGRDQDTGTLMNGIKRMSEWIGIKEKAEPIRDAEEEQAAELRLKLVGAMFITPEKFDDSPGRRGLDKF